MGKEVPKTSHCLLVTGPFQLKSVAVMVPPDPHLYGLARVKSAFGAQVGPGVETPVFAKFALVTKAFLVPNRAPSIAATCSAEGEGGNLGEFADRFAPGERTAPGRFDRFGLLFALPPPPLLGLFLLRLLLLLP